MGELEAFDAAFVQMCKKEGVPLLSSRGHITTYINDMGEEKKNVEEVFTDMRRGAWFHINRAEKGLPPVEPVKESGMLCGSRWREATKSDFNPAMPTHVVRTGKISGLMVVDFDDTQVFERTIKRFPALKEMFCVKTRQGAHIYGRHTEAINKGKNTTNKEEGIDTRGENGCVFAPPTKYMMTNSVQTCYAIANVGESKKLKIPFPPEFISFLVKLSTKKTAAATKGAKQVDFIQSLRQDAEEQAGENNGNFILKALRIIKPKWKNEYDDYMKMVIACSRYGKIKDDIRKEFITEEYPKSHKTDEAFNELWAAYQGKQTSGIPTICFYAKLSDPKKFAELYLELPSTFEVTNFGVAAVALTLLDDVVCWDELRKTAVILDENTQYWRHIESGSMRLKYLIMNALQAHYNTALNILYPKLAAIDEEDPEWSVIRAKIHTTTANKEKVETTRTLDDIYKMFMACLESNTQKGVEFGNVPNLLPFKNGMVLDLEKVEWRKAHREDHITRHTNTIYEEPTEQNVAKMRKILKQILPKEEYYKTYMSVLWSSLYGRMPEKIVFCVGGGRNGKSKINTDLLKSILGERTDEAGLYYTGIVESLMGAVPTGGDPAMANLADMRAAVYGEPKAKSKFSANRIKLVTGQHTINARKLYSNKCECPVYCTYIVEVNKLCKFDDDGVSLEDRIIIVPFISYFTDAYEEWNIAEHIYPKDINLDIWLRTNWNAFMPIVMEHAKEMNRTKGINLHEFETPEMRKEVKEYVSRGNDLYQFFKDHYKFTESNEDTIRAELIRTKYRQETKHRVSAADFVQMIRDNNLLKRRYAHQHYIAQDDPEADKVLYRRMMYRIVEKDTDDNGVVLPDQDSDEECDDI